MNWARLLGVKTQRRKQYTLFKITNAIQNGLVCVCNSQKKTKYCNGSQKMLPLLVEYILSNKRIEF